MNDKDKEEALTLELLEAVGGGDTVTQRHLSRQLGVALGLTNLYVKRCVRKGWIKIKLAPVNRYFYYLTRKGFAEKSRLTAKYLTQSFEFYRRAAASCVDVYRTCAVNGWKQIVFCGVSELAEIGSVRARDHDIMILGTYDPESSGSSRFLDLPVWVRVEDIPPCDAYVLTEVGGNEAIVNTLAKTVPPDRMLIPTLLEGMYARAGGDRAQRIRKYAYVDGSAAARQVRHESRSRD